MLPLLRRFEIIASLATDAAQSHFIFFARDPQHLRQQARALIARLGPVTLDNPGDVLIVRILKFKGVHLDVVTHAVDAGGVTDRFDLIENWLMH